MTWYRPMTIHRLDTVVTGDVPIPPDRVLEHVAGHPTLVIISIDTDDNLCFGSTEGVAKAFFLMDRAKAMILKECDDTLL